MVTIYALCEPGTFVVRYVGKANNLASRLRCHKWEVKSSKLHNRKINWLRSLKGKTPSVLVLAEVPKEEWQEAERYWIKEFRSQGFDLTNFADGGQTSPVEGRGHSEETKKKMRAMMLASGRKPPSRKGTTSSVETRQRQREASLRIGCKPPLMGGWNKGIKRTHCPSGHEYKPETTRVYCRKDRGYAYQICLICEHANAKRHQQLKSQSAEVE